MSCTELGEFFKNTVNFNIQQSTTTRKQTSSTSSSSPINIKMTAPVGWEKTGMLGAVHVNQAALAQFGIPTKQFGLALEKSDIISEPKMAGSYLP